MDRFDIRLIGGENDGIIIYTSINSNYPSKIELIPPLILNQGMGLELEVTYTNDTDNDIEYGFFDR